MLRADIDYLYACFGHHHTIIPQISVRLSFNFHGNHSHDALRARPMCCSQPDDVPFLFDFAIA